MNKIIVCGNKTSSDASVPFSAPFIRLSKYLFRFQNETGIFICIAVMRPDIRGGSVPFPADFVPDDPEAEFKPDDHNEYFETA